MPDEFVLDGGTALALHLGHRSSIDFDLFARRSLNLADLEADIPFLAGAKIIQREKNTLSAIVDRGVLMAVEIRVFLAIDAFC